MRLSIDTSAFVKRYVAEPGSGEVQSLLSQTSELGLSVLVLPETISTLNRRLREGALTTSTYGITKRRVLTDVRDAYVIQLVPSVVAWSVKILEQNSIRAMDALHIASALEWGANLFVTADLRQLSAARSAGMRVHYIGAQN